MTNGIDNPTDPGDFDRRFEFCTRPRCPDCEHLLADRWYKDAPEHPRDEHGRIVPYVDETARERAAIIWADEQPQEARAVLEKASAELRQRIFQEQQ